MQTILLDACVLYPATLRDFLLRLVRQGLVVSAATLRGLVR